MNNKPILQHVYTGAENADSPATGATRFPAAGEDTLPTTDVEVTTTTDIEAATDDADLLDVSWKTDGRPAPSTQKKAPASAVRCSRCIKTPVTRMTLLALGLLGSCALAPFSSYETLPPSTMELNVT